MLVYRDPPRQAADDAITIVGLHDQGFDLEQLRPLEEVLGSRFRLVTPQAPRSVTAASRGPGYEVDGYRWYCGEDATHPDVATFGESLWQVEQFLDDVIKREAGRVILLGHGQGAMLAATMAGIMPDRLVGVAAIAGYVPEIPGWTIPAGDAAGLPVLLVHDPGDKELPVDGVQRTADDLCRLNAAVDLQEVAGASHNPLAAAPVVCGWLADLAPPPALGQ